MEQIRTICKQNAAFLAGWLVVTMAAVVALAVVPKAELHLALNGYHTAWLDSFFYHYTHFCAGGVVVSIPVITLFLMLQRYYVEGVTGGAVKG